MIKKPPSRHGRAAEGKLLAPGLVVAKDGGVGVGGFHDCVIGPMLAAHVAERIELAKIVRNIALIRFAAQQAVDDGDDLSSGDVAVCAEGTILVAG